MPFPNLEGRPSKCTPQEKLEVYKAFEKFIKVEDNPTVVGFCVKDKTAQKYDITRENIKDWDQFTPLVKRAIAKQEHFAEEWALEPKHNPTFAIFKLKQPAFGWKDKTEIEHSGEIKRGLSDEDLDVIINRGRAGQPGQASSST